MIRAADVAVVEIVVVVAAVTDVAAVIVVVEIVAVAAAEIVVVNLNLSMLYERRSSKERRSWFQGM